MKVYTQTLGQDSIDIAYTVKRDSIVLDPRVWLHFEGLPAASGLADLETAVPSWYEQADIRDRIHRSMYEGQ